MERVAVAVALIAVALAVAYIVKRRTLPADAPTQPLGFVLPAQLDRADFAHPERERLVVVFTSATCDSCAETVAKAKVLESARVAYDEIAWQDRKAMHDRYRIEVVPATLIADAAGVVIASFIGKPKTADLWSAVT